MNRFVQSVLFCSFFVLVYFLAPVVMKAMGKPDSAAWVQLWLIPTGILGIIFSLVFAFVPSTWCRITVLALALIHLAVSIGFFPK